MADPTRVVIAADALDGLKVVQCALEAAIRAQEQGFGAEAIAEAWVSLRRIVIQYRDALETPLITELEKDVVDPNPFPPGVGPGPQPQGIGTHPLPQ